MSGDWLLAESHTHSTSEATSHLFETQIDGADSTFDAYVYGGWGFAHDGVHVIVAVAGWAIRIHHAGSTPPDACTRTPTSLGKRIEAAPTPP